MPTLIPAINKDNLTAVILAGGQGSRLQGQDKGLVSFQGRPIIETILAAIAPQVATIIINANRNETRYAQYGYPVMRDDLAHFQGPLAGVATALNQAKTSHILTLPCDAPFVSADYADKMLDALTKDTQHLAVAHGGNRLQPTHALIPVDLLDHLREYLQSGNRKLGLWFTQQPHTLVDFSDCSSLFDNINTAEQLQHYQEQGA